MKPPPPGRLIEINKFEGSWIIKGCAPLAEEHSYLIVLYLPASLFFDVIIILLYGNIYKRIALLTTVRIRVMLIFDRHEHYFNF